MIGKTCGCNTNVKKLLVLWTYSPSVIYELMILAVISASVALQYKLLFSSACTEIDSG